MATTTDGKDKKSLALKAPTKSRDLAAEVETLQVRLHDLEMQMETMEGSFQKYLTIDTLITLLTGEVSKKQKRVVRHREYTDEERAAIRERLAAGKLAKANAREAKANT